MIDYVSQAIVKAEYNERLKRAEMMRRIRNAEKSKDGQNKRFSFSLWKRLPQTNVAKPALRTK
jgi:hypothetical protein